MKNVTKLAVSFICATFLMSASAMAAKKVDPYQADLDMLRVKDKNFRSVLYTGNNMQLALVEIPKGGETGVKQFKKIEVIVFVEKGSGKLILNGTESKLEKGKVIVITAGNSNNIINTGSVPLELYAIVSPPMHEQGAVFKTKEDVDKVDGMSHISNK